MRKELSLVVLIASFCILTCSATANIGINNTNNFATENPEAIKYVVKGIEAYKLGNYEEANRCYDIAIAMEPETETAEAGWAGKELSFYKQGKKYEALCCYCKIKNIDRSTNLIEKSKSKLLNSVSGSTRASFLDGFLSEDTLAALEYGGEVLLEEAVIMSAAPETAAVATTFGYVGAAVIIGVIAYEHREEITNYIESIFYEINSTQINMNNTLRTFI